MTLDTQTLSTVEFDSTDSSPVSGPVDVIDGQDDDASPEGAQNTQGPDTAGVEGNDVQAAKAAGDKAAAEEQDKLDRLDKHPRFQELVREKNATREELKALRAEHQKVVAFLKGQHAQGQAQSRPQATDYAAKYAEVDRKVEEGEISVAEARRLDREIRAAEERDREQTQEAKATEKAKVGEIFQSFKAQNPDFEEVAKSDEFKQARQANPMHDALSAYYAAKYARSQAELKDAVAKAIKETEERITKNTQAKRTAASLGAGPRGNGYDPDAMLKDTSKHGGPVAVGAARLRAMRAQGGG